jgi:hypothetical protein
MTVWERRRVKAYDGWYTYEDSTMTDLLQGTILFEERNASGNALARARRLLMGVCQFVLAGMLLLPCLARAQSTGIVVPDSYMQPGDNGDDGLSIQRAVNALCANGGGEMQFLARHYRIHTAISQTCPILSMGQGWLERSPTIATAGGTWLDDNVTGAPMWSVTGGGSIGSEFDDLAVDQPGQPAAPAQTVFLATISGTTLTASAVGGTLAVGQVIYGPGAPLGEQITGFGTGNGGSGTYTLSKAATVSVAIGMTAEAPWTPAAVPYVFYIGNTGGYAGFRHILMDGVTDGIDSFNSGRTFIDGLYGQWFSNAVLIDESEDVDRIYNLHAWTYWSTAPAVIAYQQANNNEITLDRVDSPFLDENFIFGARSGVYLGSSSYGVTTGIQAGKISCDSTLYCLDVEAANTSGQFAMIRDFGQAGISSGIPLAGASAVNFGAGGQGIFQISSLNAGLIDNAAITDSNASACSNVTVGATYASFQASAESSVAIFSAPSQCGGTTSGVTLSSPPAVLTAVGQSFNFGSGAGAAIYLAPVETYATAGSSLPVSGTLQLNDPSTSDAAAATFAATNDANGVNLKLTGNGGTTPNKYIRVINGNLAVVSSNYGATIFNLTDAGALSAPSLQSSGKGIFSQLGACNTGMEGTLASITDSMTNSWGAVINGGGTQAVLAYCDGANWTVAAK